MNGFTFQHAAPETQGVPSGAVSEWVRLISELDTVHSFMLMRHDKIIAQAWWSPCRPEYKHELFSLSKSFTSAAIGIAQAEGCLRIDDRLAGFFPEKISAARSATLISDGEIPDISSSSRESVSQQLSQHPQCHA